MAMKVAIGTAISAAAGALFGGIASQANGGSFGGGAKQGAITGSVEGFMWSSIFAAGSALRGLAKGRICFAEGTLVLTNEGHKRIEDIEANDLVWAYNEETGTNDFKPVTQLFRNETAEWYNVHINNELIKCTAEHPFYIIGKGWVRAKDLTAGDRLLRASGECGIISSLSIERCSEPQITYNFEVADYHTYYVGEVSVLVHNRCVLGRNMEKAGTVFKSDQHAHHLYPTQFAPEFSNAGIIVDDAINGLALNGKIHLAGHKKYNSLWKGVNFKELTAQTANAYMKEFMLKAFNIIM